MRKLVVISSVFLIFSGIVLAYPRLFPWAEESSAFFLLHLWTGLFFLVIFPIYSWDHIKGHANRLRELSLLTFSGIIQLIAGFVFIITWIALLIFDIEAFELPRIIHLVLTFILGVSLVLHKFSKK